MRVAFLCKRRYMGKDVILDRYARLYEIPFQLARLGHDVRGFCLSYQGYDEGQWSHDVSSGHLQWESRSLGRLRVPALTSYPRHLLQRLRAFGPDIVIGASDIPHVALSTWLAKRLGVPCTIDLYDNFEGFGQARIPGMVPMLRHAVRNAPLVTTTSQPLADYVRDTYHAYGKVVAMPSTIDKAMFHPRSKCECRQALGLPLDAILIGTAGGLMENRGIGTLYEAWKMLAAQNNGVHLVLAGPTDNHCPPPCGERVHYLGMLSHAHAAMLFCALDIGVIYLRDTPFGRFCFPQKAYEMMACGLPIVAASIGVMPSLLNGSPSALYRADDPGDLARAITDSLHQPHASPTPIKDWAQIMVGYEADLRELLNG